MPIRSLDSPQQGESNDLFTDKFGSELMHYSNIIMILPYRSCYLYEFHHSTYNISTNISLFLTRVWSLDFSYWVLFNSLFIGYLVPNIHGDNTYNMWVSRVQIAYINMPSLGRVPGTLPIGPARTLRATRNPAGRAACRVCRPGVDWWAAQTRPDHLSGPGRVGFSGPGSHV